MKWEDGQEERIVSTEKEEENDFKNREVKEIEIKCEHAKWEDLVEEEEEDIEKIHNSKDYLLCIEVLIEGKLKVQAVVDIGATHSCINKELYEKLTELKYVKGELPVANLKLVNAVGRKLTTVQKQIMVEMFWQKHRYMVTALVEDKLFTALVLGLKWLKENDILIICGKNRVMDARIHEEIKLGDMKDTKESKEDDKGLKKMNDNVGGKQEEAQLGILYGWTGTEDEIEKVEMGMCRNKKKRGYLIENLNMRKRREWISQKEKWREKLGGDWIVEAEE